jgi:hypothetical protein
VRRGLWACIDTRWLHRLCSWHYWQCQAFFNFPPPPLFDTPPTPRFLQPHSRP